MMKLSYYDKDDTPTVAIVGRPNVGKSTLFNRILKRRLAIVHEESGVTRDRIVAGSECFGKNFLLVDTGGLGFYKGERGPSIIDDLIRKQLDVAIQNAEKIILVVDVKSGLVPLDKDISNLLREHNRDVVVAANKADNEKLADSAIEFTELGFEKIIPISCLHNHSIDDLLEEVTNNFSEKNAELSQNSVQYPKIAIIGRPNVGKSSILNRILGQERVIVNDSPGTTRDAIDVHYRVDGKENKQIVLNLIDTAGIRLKRNIKSAVEYFSLVRTRKTIKRSDIALIVLDATTLVSSLDKKICGLVVDEQRPCIILANKWDLACKNFKQKELIRHIRDSLPFLDYAPILTCCALSGYNFEILIEEIIAVHERLQIKIPTPIVNTVLKDILDRYHPNLDGKNRFKVFYGVHTQNNPPTFLLFVNKAAKLPANDLANIKKHLRNACGLFGLPIKVLLKER